ncbi:MAG: DUF6465 family protein [Eubacterium sp.]|nr:DUF6465 family protein [Eubacterium sp.]MDY5498073.1 DUF6465 family protein [Anaerobutyricum sp.]
MARKKSTAKVSTTAKAAAAKAKTVTTKAKAVKDEVKIAAERAVDKVAESQEVKEVAAHAKETVKDTGAKVADKARKVTKKVEEVKTAVTCETEVYLQYQGYESLLDTVTERIKKQYEEEGHKESEMKSLKIYLKPEEASAYYVINEENSGKVFLF